MDPRANSLWRGPHDVFAGRPKPAGLFDGRNIADLAALPGMTALAEALAG